MIDLLFYLKISIIQVIIITIIWTSFLWRLSALVLVGIFIETIALCRRQLIADFNVKNNFLLWKTRYSFGSISAVLDEITNFGGLAGVILIGLLNDLVSWTVSLGLSAAIMIWVFGIFIRKKIISKQGIID